MTTFAKHKLLSETGFDRLDSSSSQPTQPSWRRHLPAGLRFRLLALMTIGLALAMPALAQSTAAQEADMGSIVGTVTDTNHALLEGATVALQGAASEQRRSVATDANGFYELHDVKPGTPYHVIVDAKGFDEWTSPAIVLQPSTSKIMNASLKITEVLTTIDVSPATQEEIATQQVKTELQQRVLGIVPNFYAVYDPHPVPLTAKLKFELALRVSVDPVTIAAIAVDAGLQQAGDTPDYGQGAKGYGQRFGADAADGFSDILIGGAILPSLLHQDPRYFYKGTGTTKSRLLYALRSPFVCKGDNGNWQPNYSSIGGDLASAAISNAYYPESNRGAGLMFGNFATYTAEREVSAIVQEFVLHKFTKQKAPAVQ